MADVKWIKIVTDIFDDEKILLIESLPDADAIIVIWFKLLCLAGKQNNQGVFLLNNKIPFTDEMFATIFRRNVATVRLALNTFERFGMIEVMNDVIAIPNWSKHQNFDQIEKKREYMREYMANKRSVQKAICEVCESDEGYDDSKSNSKTNSKANSKTNSKANVSSLDKNKNKNKNKNIIYGDFERLWSMYPKKKGSKASAFKSYERAIENGVTNETIENAIKALIEDIKRNKTEQRFIPYGSTWFNQERWNDDYTAGSVSKPDYEGGENILDELDGII